jgi:hypothetical protein
MTKFKLSEAKNLNKLTNWKSPPKPEFITLEEENVTLCPLSTERYTRYHLRSYSNVFNTD